MTTITTLQELELTGLRELYSAENQTLAAFPDLVAAVTSEQLARALEKHQRETAQHVVRLETIFAHLGVTPAGGECGATRALLTAMRGFIRDTTPGALRDAALVGAAQKLEHLEIAAYGTVRTFAEQMKNDRAVRLLEQTLTEEKATDEALSELALSTINPATTG